MCQCGPDVRVQEYQNQVVLKPPFQIVTCLGDVRETVCVDRCLADEVQQLWLRGIKTTGCCCGHNKHRHMAYIGVAFENIVAMKDLGYAVRPNPMRPADEDSFVPKTPV